MKGYHKAYLFAAIIGLMVINGCNPSIIPLKGKYVTHASTFTSTKSSDLVWQGITQLFTEKGLAIKNIDKTKGLIVSQETSFISAYTFEDTDGQLKNPQAWVVLEKVFNKKKEWVPETIYSQWNIQITESEKGTTTIEVAPIVICTYHPKLLTSVEIRGQSTGRLEELIAGELTALK